MPRCPMMAVARAAAYYNHVDPMSPAVMVRPLAHLRPLGWRELCKLRTLPQHGLGIPRHDGFWCLFFVMLLEVIGRTLN